MTETISQRRGRKTHTFTLRDTQPLRAKPLYVVHYVQPFCFAVLNSSNIRISLFLFQYRFCMWRNLLNVLGSSFFSHRLIKCKQSCFGGGLDPLPVLFSQRTKGNKRNWVILRVLCKWQNVRSYVNNFLFSLRKQPLCIQCIGGFNFLFCQTHHHSPVRWTQVPLCWHHRSCKSGYPVVYPEGGHFNHLSITFI